MRRALFLGGCLWCAPAVAQTGVSWNYSAPPECPNELEFRAEVSENLLRDPAATGPLPPQNRGAGVHVEVRLEPSEHRASLRLEEPDADVVERTIEGDTCGELASGLALIVALAFGAPQKSAVAPPAAPPPKQTPDLTPPAGEHSAPPGSPRAAARVMPDRLDAPPGRSPALTSSAVLVEAGAGGLFHSFWAPGGGLVGDVFLRLAQGSPRAWSLRLAGLYGSRSVSFEGRRAEFSFFAARSEGCPISRRLPLNLTAEACVAVELGALRGRGDANSALLEGASRTIFWAAAGASGRIRARFADRLFLEGQAELGVPLVRHEFVFDEPRERVFRVPALGWGAGVGFSLEFL